ncbi:MAG: endonuclease III domain-containing protein [Candidatus Brocadiia bacterium]
MPSPTPQLSEPKEKIGPVLDALAESYGIPSRADSDPLEVLVHGILSQNTSDLNSGRAWNELKVSYGSWEEMAGATNPQIAEAIKCGGLADQKAAAIGELLDWLGERGEYSLNFLEPLSAEEAEKKLTQIKGIGVKTARLALLFGFGKPTFVVDTHVLRVGQRLRLIPADCSRIKAHKRLDELVPDKRKYSAHLNMIEHGRELCHPSSPECEKCPVQTWCVFTDELRDD